MSGFLWLAFAAIVVFAAVELAIWILKGMLENRGHGRPSPDRLARRLRG